MQIEQANNSCTFKEMSIGKLYYTTRRDMFFGYVFHYYFIKCKDSNEYMFGDCFYLVCLSDNTVTQEKDVDLNTKFYPSKSGFRLRSE